MVKFLERTLDDKQLSYSANGVLSVDLPRDHLIQRVGLTLSFTGTNGVTPPTYKTGGIFNTVAKVELIASTPTGTRVITSASAVMLAKKDLTEKGSMQEHVLHNTASAAGVSSGHISLDFMLDPKVEDDLSALLPAYLYNSLTLRVTFGDVTTTGANSVASANGVAWTGTVTPVLREVLLEQGDKIDPAQLILLLTTERVYTVAASGELPMDLPIGNAIRQVLVAGRINSVNVDTFTMMEVKEKGLFVHRRADWKDAQRAIQKSADIISGNWDNPEWLTQSAYVAPLGRTDRGVPAGLSGFLFDIGKSTAFALHTQNMKSGDIQLKVTCPAPSGTSDLTVLVEEAM